MNKIFTLTFLLFTYQMLSAQDCGGRYQTEIYSNVNVTTVKFGEAVNNYAATPTLQELEMDIYQADGDTATNRPVVIFCFGGSFVGGSRNSSELVSFATSLAKRGFVCASIDYRIASSPLTLLSEENMIKVVFGAVQDGKAAIRFFRKDFDEGNSLGINPDNIIIGGTSAGGILAINLAYVDTMSKLPTNWQAWANEIGGIEGNSGNPGYCSYPNGVFSFAGAVGDTSYINANDVPFYSCHATGDQTVRYDYGSPLQGFAPVSLYGSGDIATRLTNLDVYHVLDTYTGGDHPPLNTTQRMNDTRDHLGEFLFNIIDCNPNNEKKSFQQGCESFYNPNDTTGIRTIQTMKDWFVYPNPTENLLNVVAENVIEEVQVLDAYGRVLLTEKVDNQTHKHTIHLQELAKGIYFVSVKTNQTWHQEAVLVK
jgi:para-nitrobenzyl esterase